jgi:hypothetical protein
MARRCILIPRPDTRLRGSTTIEPGYPKPYTPEQMREWADDLDRYNRTPPADRDRWRALADDQLTPDQRRVVAVHDTYFTEASRGIKGSLRDDGTVELDGGRHRAGYMLERDVDPIPVWVSAPDERQLDAFEAQCNRELPRARNEAAAREQPPSRVALDREPERSTNPDTGADRART